MSAHWLLLSVWPVLLASGLPLPAKDAGNLLQVTRTQPVIEIQQRMPDHAEHGEPIPIEIVVTNVGTVPAQDLTVTDVLPAGYELLEAAPVPDQVRGTLFWSLGGSEPKEQHVLHMRLALKPGAMPAELRNTVTATFRVGISCSRVILVKRPALKLSVSGPETGLVGDTLPYRLTVTNAGTSPARDVLLTLTLPPGVYHPYGPDLENALGVLEVGQSRTVSLPLTPRQPGEVRCQVRVNARAAEAVGQELVLRVKEVRLGITANGPKVCYPDWPCTYDLTVSNDGTGDAPPLTLTVHLPRGIAFARAGKDAAYDAASHSVVWKLPGLRAGDKKTVLLNGIAKETGAQEGKATLTGGPRGSQQAAWATRVVPMSAAAPE